MIGSNLGYRIVLCRFDIIFLEERLDLSSGEGYGSCHYSNPYPACGAFGRWELFGLVRHISSS
jgi:hypothetical protein